MLQLDNPLFDPIVKQYHEDMAALADRAFAGDINERQYRREVERITLAVILLIYLLGGGNPTKGKRFITEQNKIAIASSHALAADLFDGRYSEAPNRTAVQGKASLLSRLALWTFTLGYIYNKSRVSAPIPAGAEEPRYKWEINPTKQNCDDCLALNGIVLTQGEWDRVGIYPQSYDLACKGFSCGCRLLEVDEPSIGFENVRFN